MRETLSTYTYKLHKAWESTHLIERVLIILIAIVLACLGCLSYYKLGEASIRTTRSSNAAKAQSLKSDIAALSSLSTITPGKTSGNLDATVTARQSLLTRISKHIYDPRPAGSHYILHPSYPTSRKHLAADTKVIQNYAARLRATTTDLTDLKKLIEYDAVTDLAQPLSSADSTERLERTQAGLKVAKSYVERSSLANKTQLAQELQKLIDQTLYVSDATERSWSDQVLQLQAQVLKSLMQSDIQSVPYVETLNVISGHYQ